MLLRMEMTALIDELRVGSPNVPPSHVPTASELAGVVGALLIYLQHGATDFHNAAQNGHDGFVSLIAPEEEVAPPAPSPEEQAAADSELAQLKADNASLQQQVQALLAQSQRTQATVEAA